MAHFGLRTLGKDGGSKPGVVRLQLGSAYLEFVSAKSNKEAAQHIAAYGEGPMALGLTVSDVSKTTEILKRKGVAAERATESGKLSIVVWLQLAVGAKVVLVGT